MTDFLATAQVRSATRADLPAIISLLADDVLGTSRESTDPNDLPVYERAFDAMTAQGGNEYLVVEREGQLLAVMQFTVIPGLSRRGRTRALLEGVRVSSACRGQGVGGWFFEQVIARARAAGCTLVQLTTDKRRDDARRFYESLGFQATHEGMKLDLPE
ncbi:Aminoalkylphosphonate N-acetyltransferase [Pandoraea iniqua]|uniref:GNAT family N-acetyltransferase n=1 Tax=Pandoraea iniqua TaxID=2508288 RepID=UPI00123FA001|nr:GNAT family N-acetyltransferase [Pandoraea iniqua]VVD76598.1 Aminoalkylphosphonate N-acetyltransferase [Pandoraea iniqua]